MTDLSQAERIMHAINWRLGPLSVWEPELGDRTPWERELLRVYCVLAERVGGAAL